MPAGVVKILSRLTDERHCRRAGREALQTVGMSMPLVRHMSAPRASRRWRVGYTVFTGLCTSAWLSISPTTNTMMPTTTSFANACDTAR
jgi:hypothetical protein